jgi:hypothetical protein
LEKAALGHFSQTDNTLLPNVSDSNTTSGFPVPLIELNTLQVSSYTQLLAVSNRSNFELRTSRLLGRSSYHLRHSASKTGVILDEKYFQ